MVGLHSNVSLGHLSPLDHRVLFLEGGGWCYGATANETKASCAGRGGMHWPPKADAAISSARSTPLPEASGADIGGIMSNNASLNPTFHEWNKVFIHYCDGASMGSSRVAPIATTDRAGKPALMWMRGRNCFNAVVHHLLTALKMDAATEVILSGGSAGGLAVFYNIDHLATLLPKGVRLTGFPDAGFFLDGAEESSGVHSYRNRFIGADPVWNVTGSGGTNLRCLAAYPRSEQWRCLMAPYIAEHIETPIFVMNSELDAWQMGNILRAACIPTPSKQCTPAQSESLRAYSAMFRDNITRVTAKPRNGAYIDDCYVHEQNVAYCFGQGMPNCVGWTPSSPGSLKWGYRTAVTVPDGRSLTPQQAFSAFYAGDRAASVAIDAHQLLDNPTCHYLGRPV